VHTQKLLSVPRQPGNHPLREALYYFDPKTGKVGYSDAYSEGLQGGKAVTVPISVNGTRLANVVFFGMGHTHGDYSDLSGNVVPQKNDCCDSDHFSRGSPSDMSFMHAGGPNGSWNYFTLGTPSGKLFQWTPESGVEPLVNK
jgi:hypothetical protein